MARMWIVLAAIAAAGAVAAAQPVVDAGTHELQPDQPGQQIELLVTGGQPVAGLEFYAQLPSGADGPCFQAADVLTGTIFEGNHDQDPFAGWQSYVHSHDLYVGVATQAGTVSAAGRIVTLTVDTTGIENGTFLLQLCNDVEEAQTNFAGTEALLSDGTLVVVPEPITLALLAGGGVALLRRRRRRSRQGRG